MFLANVLKDPNVMLAGGALAGLVIGFLAGSVASKKNNKPKKSSSKRGKQGRPAQKRKSPRTRTANSNGLVEIYVGNMSYDMDEGEMREMFEKFGTVASARLIDNRRNGKSKGYGFIEMPNRPEAEAAVKALNNKDVMGRKLRVNEARNKQRDD